MGLPSYRDHVVGLVARTVGLSSGMFTVFDHHAGDDPWHGLLIITCTGFNASGWTVGAVRYRFDNEQVKFWLEPNHHRRPRQTESFDWSAGSVRENEQTKLLLASVAAWLRFEHDTMMERQRGSVDTGTG